MEKLLNRTEIKYDNGLTHIHMEVPYLKTTAVALITKAGSINELTPEFYGAAHFLEHMLFNGSKRWTSEEAVTDHYAKYGVIENAWTYYSMTRYYIVAPNSAIEHVMPVLFDRFFFPILDPKLVEKEKGIILEERKMGESENMKAIFNCLREYHYPKDSSYNHRTIGTQDSISQMTVDTLRSFHDKNYSSDHAVLFTYGGLPVQKVEQYVKNIIKDFDIKPTATSDMSYPDGDLSFDTPDGDLLMPKDIDTNYLSARADLPMANGAFELAAYRLFHSITSMGKGALIDKHLIVGSGLISSGEIEFEILPDRTLYYETATTTNDDYEKVFSELHRVLEMGINPDKEDFERGKGYVLGFQLRLIESTFDMAYAANYYDVDIRTTYPNKEKVTFEEFRKAIKTMTLDDYSSFMQKNLKDMNLTRAVLGKAIK